MAKSRPEPLTSNISDALMPASESSREGEAAAAAEPSLDSSTSGVLEPLIPASGSFRGRETAPESSENNRVPEIQSVPIQFGAMRPNNTSLLAVAICLAVATLLLMFPFVTIQITPFYAVLSTTGRNLYTAVTTIIAGLISAVAMGQLKELWVMDILYVEHRLSKQKPKTSCDTAAPDSADFEEQLSSTVTQTQHRRAVVALGLGGIFDKSHFYLYTLSMLVAGLMTTGIVAGIAPEIINVTVAQYGDWSMAIGSSGKSLEPHEFDNWQKRGNHFPVNDNNLLFWQTGPKTGTYYNISDAAVGSQGTELGASTGAISQYLDTFDPDHGIAYVLAGVPVAAGAIGVPVYFDQAFDYQFVGQLANYDWDAAFDTPDAVPSYSSLYSDGQLISSNACVPVLKKNPVRCEASCSPLFIPSIEGTHPTLLEAAENGPFSNPVAVAGCGNNFTTQASGSSDPLSSGGICLQNHTIGHATYLIAEDQTTGMPLTPLHSLLDTVNGSSSTLSCNVTILVTCQVNLQDSLEFRMTSLKFLGQVNGGPAGQHASLPSHKNRLWGQTPVTTNFMEYGLTAGADKCNPDFVNEELLSQDAKLSSTFPDLLGYGIAAAWKQIRDQQTIRPLMNAIRGNSGFFNDSQNELEDLLGVVHGMALSQYYQGQCGADVENMTVDWPRTYFTATSMRIGPGTGWAAVYALPALYTLALLLWFLYRRYLFATTYRPAAEPKAM